MGKTRFAGWCRALEATGAKSNSKPSPKRDELRNELTSKQARARQVHILVFTTLSQMLLPLCLRLSCKIPLVRKGRQKGRLQAEGVELFDGRTVKSSSLSQEGRACESASLSIDGPAPRSRRRARTYYKPHLRRVEIGLSGFALLYIGVKLSGIRANQGGKKPGL